ncbi:exonuclease VII small subunit domain-containing protein [Fusarium pseudoanthophilum]|uniref:Exonuclease VII small subunit domain-containing protein n=1 Tax=Fusarium pseudoanthophilum TaxID=48495 RepID=A0A8H5KHJ9_9HYPO|nr:exonuclease VII small subunit domain-containing protein [Fusarium pseudoanthophilum]
MSDTIQAATNIADTADRNALMEEAIEIASQWAQEKIENFLGEIERNGNNHKLLKISHIISRRTSIDVFTGASSGIGKFARDIIEKLDDAKVMESLGNLAGSLLNKLFGSASGSAQTEKIYEVVSDELGELNRLDAFFFCYRFASRGINKAVIGTCIVRSAAIMVDDNAYRVVLNSSATLEDAERAAQVAKYQRQVLDENGNPEPADSTLLEARAKLTRWTRNQILLMTKFLINLLLNTINITATEKLALNQKALETPHANYTKAVEAAAEVQKRLTGIQTKLEGVEIAGAALERVKEILNECIAILVELKVQISKLTTFFNALSTMVKVIIDTEVKNFDTDATAISQETAQKGILKLNDLNIETIYISTLQIKAYFDLLQMICQMYTTVHAQYVNPDLDLLTELSKVTKTADEIAPKRDQLNNFTDAAHKAIRACCPDILHKVGVPMPAAGIIQAMRTGGEVIQDAVKENLPTGMRVEQNADAAMDF